MSRSNQPSYPFLKGHSKRGGGQFTPVIFVDPWALRILYLQGRDAPTPRQLYAYYAKAALGPGNFSDGHLGSLPKPRELSWVNLSSVHIGERNPIKTVIFH